MVLKYSITAVCGFSNCHVEVCRVSGGALRLLGPYLRERAFWDNTCHSLLRKCYLLWPAPSVQSNFQGKKSPFDVVMADELQVCVCLCPLFTKGYVRNLICDLFKSKGLIGVVLQNVNQQINCMKSTRKRLI